MYDSFIKKNNRSIGGFSMSAWSFFFILIGVCFLTSQVFRLIDAIEHPSRHSHRSAVDRG